MPLITIPEGMYALVQAHGRDLDAPKGGAVWSAGLHTASPWIKVSHLVTKQHIVFATPVKGCKTADDVTVEIDMTLVFRIMGDSVWKASRGIQEKKFFHSCRGTPRWVKISR